MKQKTVEELTTLAKPLQTLEPIALSIIQCLLTEGTELTKMMILDAISEKFTPSMSMMFIDNLIKNLVRVEILLEGGDTVTNPAKLFWINPAMPEAVQAVLQTIWPELWADWKSQK